MLPSIPDPDPIPLTPPTEADLADLCRCMHRLAWRAYRRQAHTTTALDLAEFEDAGMAGLTYALRTWTPTLGIPFPVLAKLNMVRRMRYARRNYLTWRYPVSGIQATRPRRHGLPVAVLRPTSFAEAVQTADLYAWLHRTMRTHRRCFTPQGWQALQDFLHERSYDEIATRDQLSVKDARRRQWRLLKFLRQHVFGQATTCAHEQQQRRRYPGHGRLLTRLAAAD